MTERPIAPEALTLAEAFHLAYTRVAHANDLAEAAAPFPLWSDLPEPNRRLLIAVAEIVLANWHPTTRPAKPGHRYAYDGVSSDAPPSGPRAW